MLRRFVVGLVCLVACGSAAASVEAGTYLFERSYYSHAGSKPVAIGHRAPTGGPQFTRPQGVAVTNGYRYQRSNITVGGQVVDQLNSWESWIQFQGKY